MRRFLAAIAPVILARAITGTLQAQSLTKADTTMMRRQAVRSAGIDTTKATIRVSGDTARIEERRGANYLIGVTFLRKNGQWTSSWVYDQSSGAATPPPRDTLVRPAVRYTYGFEKDAAPQAKPDTSEVKVIRGREPKGPTHVSRYDSLTIRLAAARFAKADTTLPYLVWVDADTARVYIQQGDSVLTHKVRLERRKGEWVALRFDGPPVNIYRTP